MATALFKKRVLVVDDDRLVCQTIANSLSEIFEVFLAYDISSALKSAVENKIQALIVDINLESESGIELCKKIRSLSQFTHIPILIITGYGDKNKLISAYQFGADDYIEKPLDLPVLKVRLLAKFKRNAELAEKTISENQVNINYETNEISQNGKTEKLSRIQIEIINFLLLNKNKKVSRDELLFNVWGNTKVEQRTIDVHMSILRKKSKPSV